MHNPRGSNNRLNEANAVRNNGNRMFDSQNNNRGGYNVGDKSDNPFDTNNPYAASVDNNFNINDRSDKQYQMGYYEGSKLVVEWTNQHGCGGSEGEDPQKANCNIVIQYMCDTDGTVTEPAMKVALRDGANTNTPTEPGSYASAVADTDDTTTGRQESKAYYYECKTRMRNKGLFLADQNLKGNTARYTRQNPDGTRRGLECPEERDYYPYWSPSPWIDAAYLTDHVEHCDYIQWNSQNVVDTYKCILPNRDQESYIEEQMCIDMGGTWTLFPAKDSQLLDVPDCQPAPWSRVNQLGNSLEGQASNYSWTLPAFTQLSNYKAATYGSTYPSKKCLMRLRYNISTDDYDPWNTTVADNDIIENNPVVDIGAEPRQGLRLAINTNQFGRTFQDRSHVFYISRLPTDWTGETVINLNVRGKRGNIVQTYPSVEYDFIPNRLTVSTTDLIHVQWTGSNTHNNGGGGGDGQAGDDGQGQGGTDRNNLVSIDDYASNFPIPLDKAEFDDQNLVKQSECYWMTGSAINDWVDCAVILATAGYATSKTADFTSFDYQMNNAPASLVGGVVMKVSTAGTYNYMSSRNNNFSNRGQKGFIVSQQN